VCKKKIVSIRRFTINIDPFRENSWAVITECCGGLVPLREVKLSPDKDCCPICSGQVVPRINRRNKKGKRDKEYICTSCFAVFDQEGEFVEPLLLQLQPELPLKKGILD
jgi:rRNA maturation endonuclease Nob1